MTKVNADFSLFLREMQLNCSCCHKVIRGSFYSGVELSVFISVCPALSPSFSLQDVLRSGESPLCREWVM